MKRLQSFPAKCVAAQQFLVVFLSASSSFSPSTSSSSSCSLCPPVTFSEQLRHRSMRVKVCNRRSVDLFFGRNFVFGTRLAVTHPEIAAEWDLDKNPSHLFPGLICSTAVQPFWWVCRNCGTSYQMAPEKRVLRGGGCPNCFNREQEADENTDISSKDRKGNVSTRTTKERSAAAGGRKEQSSRASSASRMRKRTRNIGGRSRRQSSLPPKGKEKKIADDKMTGQRRWKEELKGERNSRLGAKRQPVFRMTT